MKRSAARGFLGLVTLHNSVRRAMPYPYFLGCNYLILISSHIEDYTSHIHLVQKWCRRDFMTVLCLACAWLPLALACRHPTSHTLLGSVMTTLEHRKPDNSQTLSSALDFKFQLLFVFEFSNFKKYIGDIYCYILLLMTLHIELLEHIFTITLYNINMHIFYMNLFWMYPTYWQNLYIIIITIL